MKKHIPGCFVIGYKAKIRSRHSTSNRQPDNGTKDTTGASGEFPDEVLTSLKQR